MLRTSHMLINTGVKLRQLAGHELSRRERVGGNGSEGSGRRDRVRGFGSEGTGQRDQDWGFYKKKYLSLPTSSVVL